MENLYYLAGHRFRVQGDAEIALLDAAGAYASFLEPTEMVVPAASCPFCHRVAADDWQVRYGALAEAEPATAPSFRVLYRFHFPEAALDCAFSHRDSSYLFRMECATQTQPALLMRYRRYDSHLLASSHRHYPSLHFSLWLAFAMLAAPMGIVPVHASTVVYREQAVMVLGESGTGKSTHTQLWCKHIRDAWLLNDDSPLLATGTGTPLVYGSPWSGKTPCYHNIGVPLRAIVRLSQAPHNRIRRLSPLAAIAALQPSCPPALSHDDYFNDLIMDTIQHTIAAVPVYHLQCRPDAAAALLCRHTLFGD